MSNPVRCFTCGQMVGHKWGMYLQLIQKEKKSIYEALELLHVKRPCCRTVLMTHSDWDDKIIAKKQLAATPFVCRINPC